MTLNLSRFQFRQLSYVALFAYWIQLLIAPSYQDTRPFTPGSLLLISAALGLAVSMMWLISIYATKRGWLWVTALFSWLLMGLVNTIGVMWQKLFYSDCPSYLLTIGILCTAYLYLYAFIGLFLPVLNHFGFLAQEP